MTCWAISYLLWRSASLFVPGRAESVEGGLNSPKLTACSKTERLCRRSTSLLKGANVGDQRFNFLVCQFFPVRVHFLFALLDDAFLDDLDSVFVLQLGLNFWVGVIFDTALPAHFG